MTHSIFFVFFTHDPLFSFAVLKHHQVFKLIINRWECRVRREPRGTAHSLPEFFFPLKRQSSLISIHNNSRFRRVSRLALPRLQGRTPRPRTCREQGHGLPELVSLKSLCPSLII